MRVFAIVAATFVMLANPASAQSWTEYNYPDAGFSIHFPTQPTIASGLYETGAGAFVGASIYSAQTQGGHFMVTVADLSGQGLDQQAALAQALEAARSKGEVKVDIPARVNGQFGRQLSITAADGSRSTLALFFAKDHLFQVEGTTLASSSDPQSGDAILFQQSLRFTGDYAGRRVAQGGPNGGRFGGGLNGQFPGRGPGGRFSGRGRRGMPQGDQMPGQMPDQAPTQPPVPAQP